MLSSGKKKVFIFLILILTGCGVYSQAPQYINYQAVARDASGNIITTAIGIKFEILQGSASGTLVYDETNNITPSSAGIFTTAIGSGAPSTGTFSAINWANSPFFLRVSIDPTGGTSYSTVGTSQLLSVPYALYAEKAGNTQTVSVSGPGVIGSYPNYTITSPGALTPSTGISISSGTITNTAPDKIVVITATTGIASVSGTYPNFNIDVPPPALNYNTGTNVLTLTQGTAVATTTLVGAGSNTVAMFAQGIASVNPVGAGSSFTVSVQSPTFTPSGPTTITGAYPNYVINSPAASTVTPANLQINPPHSTSTISANNYSINIVPTNITGPGVLGSYPNYTVTAVPATTVVAGTNVTVGGAGPAYTVNAIPTLSLGGNVLSISGGNSVTLPSSPSTSITPGSANVIVSGSAPSYTINTITPPLSLTGSTLTSGVSTNSVDLSTLSVWSNSVGVLYPTTITNSVAIGTATASAPLEAIGNSTATIGRFANSTNTGGAVITADHVGGSSAATYYGVKANANAIGGNTYGLYGSAGGGGTAIGVYGSMNGAGGYGVYGIAPAGGNGVGVAGISNAGSTAGAFGVFGSSLNSYGGVFQNSAATITSSLGGQTYSGLFSGGNVGINMTTPANRLHVVESANGNAAIFGNQTFATSNANAHGISGITSNANIGAAGIFGANSGGGPGVYGMKTTSNGPAGRFDITFTGNTADAIMAQTNGIGAAVHAVNGPTVAGSSNAAVWLENGHLKSSQSVAPTTSTVSVSGGGISSATVTLSSGSTDVKGTLLAVITTTGIINQNNNFAVRVNFNKAYTTPPVVIMTPASDNGVLQPFISGLSATSFTVTFKNATTTNMSAGGTFSVNYNYMVIE